MDATLLGYILEKGDGVNSHTLGRAKRRPAEGRGNQEHYRLRGCSWRMDKTSICEVEKRCI